MLMPQKTLGQGHRGGMREAFTLDEIIMQITVGGQGFWHLWIGISKFIDRAKETPAQGFWKLKDKFLDRHFEIYGQG